MTEFVFINGEFRTAGTVAVDPADRGFLLGDGVFDTMLAVAGAPVEAEAHFERLARHAAVMGIPLTSPPDMLEFHVTALLDRNGMKSGRHAVRTTLSRGPGPRGLSVPEAQKPTLMIRAASALPPKDTVTVAIAHGVRRNEGSPLSRVKSLNYGDNVLALREANKRGAEDAILLNNKGAVCCATASNIFVVIGGRWVTPPLEDGVLDGITRARLIREHAAVEQSIFAGDLNEAEAIYLCNSVAGVRRAILISEI